MNLRVSLFSTLVVAGLAIGSSLAKVDVPPPLVEFGPTPDHLEAAKLLQNYLGRFHYQPVPLDDALSRRMLKAYIDSLDGSRWFFNAADIADFQRLENELDDLLRANDLSPAYRIFARYRQRVAERTSFARAQLQNEPDFSVDERLELDRREQPWAADEAELDDLWRRRVKDDWLRLELANRSAEQIRETLDKRYTDLNRRVGELDTEDVFQTYINAYASSIEPHTSYLAPRASENFQISMRLSLEGIGAVLMKDGDHVTIREIVKGGPADLSGKVHVGDRITGIGQGDTGSIVDVVGWRLDDVVDKVRGPKDTVVRLEILAKDVGPSGPSEVVNIRRDKVKLEEQAAKSRVLDTEIDGLPRRIGVIELPTFYLDFAGRARGDEDYRSSTRDVKRLIAEMQEQGVDGLLIDLRNNGGGSLVEATELTGLFIDKGPVVQIKGQGDQVDVETDDSAGMVWDGPLAVLVNRSSASASEIFAAAIQDYGRGLILGENTFGKGTVQNLIDLDRVTRERKPRLGQLKITTSQFFRIDGGSTQLKGVRPDVSFPTAVEPEDFGESSYPNALPWTSIAPSQYRAFGDFAAVLPILQARHESRLKSDQEFGALLEDIEAYRVARAQTEVSLLKSLRIEERNRAEERRKARKAAGLAASDMVHGSDEDPEGENGDDATGEADAERDDAPDLLLREAARVLSDLIELARTDQRTAQREERDAALAN